MNQKPGDLLLSVTEFFGILIPGAILVFLHGNLLFSPLGLSVNTLLTPSDWIPAFFVAYVAGHFLMSFSQPLDGLAERFPSQETTAYFNAVRDQIKLPPGVGAKRFNVFYAVRAYILVHNAEATADVERQVGEYRLFRSLALLFLLDILLSAITASLSPLRLGGAALMACLAAYRFQWIFDLTYRQAFNIYLQLPQTAPGGKA